MLELRSIVTKHGHITALRGVDITVERNELLAIIGANGAGKSTLMGTVAGLYQTSKGTILFDGRDVTSFNSAARVREGITLVPERRQLFDSLSVWDNLMLGAYHRHRHDKKSLNKEATEMMEFFPALQGKESVMAGNLSGGLQQMVAIARGMMSKPKVLMLDEPSVGLAPIVLQEIMELLVRLREMGTTIVLVEQNAKAALRIASRAYVLERGEVVLEGSSQSLLENARVQQAYLGKGVANAIH